VGGLLTALLGRSLGVDMQLQYDNRSARGSPFSYKGFTGGIFLRYSGAL
jgi:hypothetical protein